MSNAKKQARSKFREDVLRRARLRCQGPGCGFQATVETASTLLDAHHILDREEWNPGEGNVKENGICLCKACHWKAERFHDTGAAVQGFAPEDLFKIIGSSAEIARAANDRMVRRQRP